MSYRALNETYVCDFCGYEEDIEADDVTWECESCGRHFCESCFEKHHGRAKLEAMVSGESAEPILCPECYGDQPCISCVHDEPGYVSVIGTSRHLCRRHYHCKPGSDRLDYEPKGENR